jgi:aldehyde dehydrogenase (NAD+)
MTAPVEVETADPRAGDPIVRDSFYIGGQWVSAEGRDTVEVIDAATEQVVGSVPLGNDADVDQAVEAARAGFEAWSQTTVEQRI